MIQKSGLKEPKGVPGNAASTSFCGENGLYARTPKEAREERERKNHLDNI
jgi:hypothetical protein